MSDNRVGSSDGATRPAGIADRASVASEAIQVRILPDGDARTASLLSRTAEALQLDLRGYAIPPGAIVEIEIGSVLYWGETSAPDDAGCRVRIEHWLDRESLALDRKHWG